jgi:glutamate-1-semialdehyde 2,1-aminomutase
VPEQVTADTLVAPYNDLDGVRELFARHGGEIAAVFVEPIAGNMSLVKPVEGFLPGLRDLCDEHGALLVFDEVMTGFRVDWGGVQTLAEHGPVTPDLTTLGKVIGGGLPLAAYGGRRDLMERIAPSGPVYQAGTLSGNPLAVAAGMAALNVLRADDRAAYATLESRGAALADGVRAAAAERGVPCTVQRQGSMVGIFFTEGPVESKADVDASDRELYKRVFHRMLEHGIHLPPSPYETFFLSTAHGDEEIAKTVEAFGAALMP